MRPVRFPIAVPLSLQQARNSAGTPISKAGFHPQSSFRRSVSCSTACSPLPFRVPPGPTSIESLLSAQRLRVALLITEKRTQSVIALAPVGAPNLGRESFPQFQLAAPAGHPLIAAEDDVLTPIAGMHDIYSRTPGPQQMLLPAPTTCILWTTLSRPASSSAQPLVHLDADRSGRAAGKQGQTLWRRLAACRRPDRVDASASAFGPKCVGRCADAAETSLFSHCAATREE